MNHRNRPDCRASWKGELTWTTLPVYLALVLFFYMLLSLGYTLATLGDGYYAALAPSDFSFRSTVVPAPRRAELIDPDTPPPPHPMPSSATIAVAAK